MVNAVERLTESDDGESQCSDVIEMRCFGALGSGSGLR